MPAFSPLAAGPMLWARSPEPRGRLIHLQPPLRGQGLTRHLRSCARLRSSCPLKSPFTAKPTPTHLCVSHYGSAISAGIDIRLAELRDLPRIFAIYNVEVLSGFATFDIEPREAGRDDEWLSGRATYHPVTVAVAGDEVVGWASIGPWSPRGAYRRTGEVSVYVDRGRRGEGTGGLLLQDLVDRARGIDEIEVLLARIAQPNPASVAVHESAGFRSFGTQRRCGEKLGRILDVELLDLHLDEVDRVA